MNVKELHTYCGLSAGACWECRETLSIHWRIIQRSSYIRRYNFISCCVRPVNCVVHAVGLLDELAKFCVQRSD